jgi:ribosome recycling factor
MQKTIDLYMVKVEDLEKEKEKELMTLWHFKK